MDSYIYLNFIIQLSILSQLLADPNEKMHLFPEIPHLFFIIFNRDSIWLRETRYIFTDGSNFHRENKRLSFRVIHTVVIMSIVA